MNLKKRGSFDHGALLNMAKAISCIHSKNGKSAGFDSVRTLLIVLSSSKTCKELLRNV